MFESRVTTDTKFEKTPRVQNLFLQSTPSFGHQSSYLFMSSATSGVGVAGENERHVFILRALADLVDY
jgi:hypothetical protein